MGYIVLARKYRPQSFEEVVKQEHVTRTLANAIESGRVAHAILFSGPRGTGKTTVARILAKAMNCEEGPTPIPCNKCRSCTEITSGSAVDVFEIDGASNNGVEQIRELRENAKYMPAHSPSKIYIIDEVHMLSTAAFNALLKILEEPPAHIMFLFATTELRKIPVTILSRCQCHDMRRIDMESICSHMAELCRKENVETDAESLAIIGREAGGSMRDALSLLDQVLSCSDGRITQELTLNLLGVIDRKALFDISAGIFSGNIPQILEILDQVYQQGHSIRDFYSRLLEHFRNLLIVKMGKRIEALVDIPRGELEQMTRQAGPVPELYLSRMMDVMMREEQSIKLSVNPRIAMELIFIRMFQVKPVLPIDTLIQKLDDLRKNPPQISVRPDTKSDDWAMPLRENQATYPAGQARVEAEQQQQPDTERLPNQKTQTVPPARTMPNRTTGPDTLPEVEAQQEQQPDPERLSNQKTETVPPARTATAQTTDPGTLWQQLLDCVAGQYPSLDASLAKSKLKSYKEDCLRIHVNGNEIVAGRIKKYESVIQTACEQILGRKMKLDIIKESRSATDPLNGRNQIEKLKQEALGHPLVESILEIFGGNVEDVKVLQEVTRERHAANDEAGSETSIQNA